MTRAGSRVAAHLRGGLANRALGAAARRSIGLAAVARAAERCVIGGVVLAVGLVPTVPSAVIATVVAGAMMATRSLAAVRADLRVRTDLYLAIADGLARADAMQPVPLPGGDAEGALSDAVYAGARVFGSVVPGLLGDAVACLLLGAVATVLLDWRLALLAAAALLVAGAASLLASRVVVRAQTKHVEALLTVHEGLGELLERREEIAATGQAREARADLVTRLARWEREALVVRLTTSVGARAPAALGGLLLGAVIASSPSIRALVAGVEGLALLSLVVLVPIVLAIARGTLELRRAGPELAILGRILDLPRLERGGEAAAPSPPRVVTARGVTFAYGSSPVVRDVTLEWKRGSVLVLAGSNGSGKSTMLRLLLGLGRPRAGTLLVDDVDMFAIDLESLRRQVAYVPQRPVLSKRRSVREALAAVRGGDAGALAALVQLGAGDDTPASFLDRTLATLSAGQAQRVALARAFASERPLLLLDEPDANLDERSVTCLAARLRALRGARSIAVAAHHPALLACADELIALGES